MKYEKVVQQIFTENDIDHFNMDDNNNQYLHIKMLKDEFNRRKNKNKSYSIRSFARQLKVASSPLSQILDGNRSLSTKLATRIGAALNWDPSQMNEFLGSIALEKINKGLKRVNPKLREIAKSTGYLKQSRFRILSNDFESISQWQHHAILEYISIHPYLDLQKIAETFNIKEELIHQYLEQLKELQLIQIEKNKFIKLVDHFETADKTKTTESLKKHQLNLLELSKNAILNTDLKFRIHSGLCFAIDESKLNEARNLVDEFMGKMSNLLENDKKSAVYQFQISLFPLEKNKKYEINS